MNVTDFPERLVHTPLMLQMEACECGAAALGMILGFHGRDVPLGELRTACGVSREGSRASSILAAARSYGLTARGLRGDVQALRELNLPVVLFWEFNHFVVLEGWTRSGRSFVLNDPACGRREVSDEEFDRGFTGVILSFSPGPEFQESPPRPPLFRELFGAMAANPGLWIFLILCSTITVFPDSSLRA